jgi:uncharacterized Zn finger protein (UPF0148 family)
MSEVTVICPKCGEKLQITLTPMPEQPSDKRPVRTEKQAQAKTISEPKVELKVEAIDWKPWKQGTGEWVNMLDAMNLFTKIQEAGGRLEHDGYRYWIFGKNRDMIARKKTRE